MRAKNRVYGATVEPSGEATQIAELYLRHEYGSVIQSSRLGPVAMRVPPTPIQHSELVCA